MNVFVLWHKFEDLVASNCRTREKVERESKQCVCMGVVTVDRSTCTWERRGESNPPTVDSSVVYKCSLMFAYCDVGELWC